MCVMVKNHGGDLV